MPKRLGDDETERLERRKSQRHLYFYNFRFTEVLFVYEVELLVRY